MKWLMVFAAVHGTFSTDQCRVLRQVRLTPSECRTSFAAERSLAANFSTKANAGTPSAPGVAAGGPSGGNPANGAAAGGKPSGPSAPSSGSGAPGSPAGGNPGNPGGGDSRPGEALPPLPTPAPPKPAISAAELAKLRGEFQDALRQRALERIALGFKPPGLPSRPGLKPPDRPGRPASKPGVEIGPGGLRGASSSGTSGPSQRPGQAR